MRGGTQNRCGETLGESVPFSLSGRYEFAQGCTGGKVVPPSSSACGRHLPQGEGWGSFFEGIRSTRHFVTLTPPISICRHRVFPNHRLFPVDIPYPLCYNKTESEYQFQCSRAGWALGENRESGANPERYRHCKRGGRSMGRKPVIGFSEKTLFRAVDA